MIPNLHAIQTLTSIKAATALNKAIPPERTSPLNILIQINTSGEDSKSGLPSLSPVNGDVAQSEVAQLARHVITACPRLRMQGLMTIGAIEQSLSGDENADFETLKQTRDVLTAFLVGEFGEEGKGKWGSEEGGSLLLSMGMSSDFEAALKAGSNIVRVGTGIFGTRRKKTDAT